MRLYGHTKEQVDQNTISVKDMIEALTKLHPNDRIGIESDTYYGNNPFGDIFTPQRTDIPNLYFIGYVNGQP